MMMTEFREEINAKQVDIERVMRTFGKQDLNFQQFETIFQSVNPEISNKSVDYCFTKIDVTKKGFISVGKFQKMFI
jgi:Ca2+-binding EF-hand superfamily protein